MDLIILEDFGIEYADGIERCAGNAALYQKLLRRYADDEKRVSGLRDAIEKMDYQVLLSVVHDMKGVAGNLGIVPLFEMAAQVVLMLQKKEYDGLEDALAQLEAINEAAIGCIHEAS